jgi:hypothetical protein
MSSTMKVSLRRDVIMTHQTSQGRRFKLPSNFHPDCTCAQDEIYIYKMSQRQEHGTFASCSQEEVIETEICESTSGLMM